MSENGIVGDLHEVAIQKFTSAGYDVSHSGV